MRGTTKWETQKPATNGGTKIKLAHTWVAANLPKLVRTAIENAEPTTKKADIVDRMVAGVPC